MRSSTNQHRFLKLEIALSLSGYASEAKHYDTHAGERHERARCIPRGWPDAFHTPEPEVEQIAIDNFSDRCSFKKEEGF